MLICNNFSRANKAMKPGPRLQETSDPAHCWSQAGFSRTCPWHYRYQVTHGEEKKSIMPRGKERRTVIKVHLYLRTTTKWPMSNNNIYYSLPSHPTSTVYSRVLTENPPFFFNKNETRVKAGKVGCHTVHLKTCQTNRLSTQQDSNLQGPQGILLTLAMKSSKSSSLWMWVIFL